MRLRVATNNVISEMTAHLPVFLILNINPPLGMPVFFVNNQFDCTVILSFSSTFFSYPPV